MRTIIALSLYLFILSSCKMSSNVPPAQPLLPTIYGNWELVQITGGFSGHGMPLTAANQMISFERNGTFICSAIEMLKVNDGTFSVFQRFSNFYNRNCFFVQLNNNNIGSIINVVAINGDTLTLSSELSDGFSYVFKRK